MALFTSLFAFSFLLSQQLNTAPSDVTKEQGAGIHIEGTILNSVTGEPVPRADVRMQRNVNSNGAGPSSYAQTSDAQGKFVFDNLSSGIYSLVAEKANFVRSLYGQREPTSSGVGSPILLNISNGQSLTKLDIKLAPQGVITGRVVDENGEQMPKIEIAWFQYAFVQGERQLQRRGQLSTDDKGEYRIANLSPADYFVAAMVMLPTVRKGGGQGASEPQERNVNTFYPNVIDSEVAVPVKVAAGAELRGIDIHVRKVRVYSIRGRVVGSEVPITKASLELSRKIGIPGAQLQVPVLADGSFEFPFVMSGNYVLKPGVGAGVLLAGGPLNVTISGGNIDDLAIRLKSGAAGEIIGTFRVDGSDLQAILKPQGAQTPASGVSAASRILVGFREIEGYQGIGNPVWPVKDDGTFNIKPVSASKYSWFVNGLPAGFYVKLARFNGQDVTDKIIDTVNSSGGTLEIVVSARAAELLGLVTDASGERKVGVRVTLWSKAANSSSFNGGVYQTSTDQNGRFRLSGLAPGSYYVAAWEETLPTGLEMYPEFLSRFSGDATTVTLEEGGQASQNVRFIPSGRITAEIAKLR